MSVQPAKVISVKVAKPVWYAKFLGNREHKVPVKGIEKL
jgi:hypothetical protein